MVRPNKKKRKILEVAEFASKRAEKYRIRGKGSRYQYLSLPINAGKSIPDNMPTTRSVKQKKRIRKTLSFLLYLIPSFHFMTRSNEVPLTNPPFIESLTFLLNISLLSRKSSAASLLSGSEEFGSRNKNYTFTVALAPLSVPPATWYGGRGYL